MKKIFLYKISPLLVAMLFLTPACTDLDEELHSEVTAESFFQTDAEFIAALGQAYSQLFSIGNHANVWTTNELQSDELVVTTKGGDWFDGGVLIQMHEHTFTPDNGFFNNAWSVMYSGINTCNRLIFQFSQLGTAEADAFIAELRAVRALWYYWALDSFGNVPLVIDFEDTSAPSNAATLDAGRQAVFSFIESELNEIIPLLSSSTGPETYGRMNQPAAQALRAKLYLNAEVYTGTARWSDVIADADAVMATGYSLMGNYSDNFAIDNSGSTENIFVVPYDKVFAGGFNWPMMMLHYASQNTFNFTAQPWNGYAVLEEFYNSYVDPVQNPGPQGPVWVDLAQSPDPRVPNGVGTQDSRLSNFLVGPQFNLDGTRTEDPGFESSEAADPDPDGAPLTYTPQNNELNPNGWRQGGARNQKYEYEVGGTPNMSNDFVVFRLADIMLAKAEALLRTGDEAGALALVNQIRTRAGVDEWVTLDLDMLLAERGREMFAEMTRRQDLIRFGKFGDPWWEKPASSEQFEVWPIPQPQIDANANLNQHAGF